MSMILKMIRNAWNARSLMNSLGLLGFDAPANLQDMMVLEPDEYTAAAIIAVSTRGE